VRACSNPAAKAFSLSGADDHTRGPVGVQGPSSRVAGGRGTAMGDNEDGRAARHKPLDRLGVVVARSQPRQIPIAQLYDVAAGDHLVDSSGRDASGTRS
jgi:hypothetical protein